MIGKYADEISVGDTFVSHGRTISESDIGQFAGLTWIIDPIFTDREFAALTPLGRQTAPGPLVMAFAMGLTEDLVHGTVFAALGIDNVRFVAPTYPGETIRVRTVVTEHRSSKSRPGTFIVVLSHEVENRTRQVVACTFARTMLFVSRDFMDELQNASSNGLEACQ